MDSETARRQDRHRRSLTTGTTPVRNLTEPTDHQVDATCLARLGDWVMLEVKCSQLMAQRTRYNTVAFNTPRPHRISWKFILTLLHA